MLSLDQHIRAMEKFITEFPLVEDLGDKFSNMTRGGPAFGGGKPRPIEDKERLATRLAAAKKGASAPSKGSPDFSQITRATARRG